MSFGQGQSGHERHGPKKTMTTLDIYARVAGSGPAAADWFGAAIHG